MCNLYSVTKSQTAIIEASRAMRDTTGNLPATTGHLNIPLIVKRGRDFARGFEP